MSIDLNKIRELVYQVALNNAPDEIRIYRPNAIKTTIINESTIETTFDFSETPYVQKLNQNIQIINPHQDSKSLGVFLGQIEAINTYLNGESRGFGQLMKNGHIKKVSVAQQAAYLKSLSNVTANK